MKEKNNSMKSNFIKFVLDFDTEVPVDPIHEEIFQFSRMAKSNELIDKRLAEEYRALKKTIVATNSETAKRGIPYIRYGAGVECDSDSGALGLHEGNVIGSRLVEEEAGKVKYESAKLSLKSLEEAGKLYKKGTTLLDYEKLLHNVKKSQKEYHRALKGMPKPLEVIRFLVMIMLIFAMLWCFFVAPKTEYLTKLNQTINHFSSQWKFFGFLVFIFCGACWALMRVEDDRNKLVYVKFFGITAIIGQMLYYQSSVLTPKLEAIHFTNYSLIGLIIAIYVLDALIYLILYYLEDFRYKQGNIEDAYQQLISDRNMVALFLYIRVNNGQYLLTDRDNISEDFRYYFEYHAGKLFDFLTEYEHLFEKDDRDSKTFTEEDIKRYFDEVDLKSKYTYLVNDNRDYKTYKKESF